MKNIHIFLLAVAGKGGFFNRHYLCLDTAHHYDEEAHTPGLSHLTTVNAMADTLLQSPQSTGL